jgi:hypothetical protein
MNDMTSRVTLSLLGIGLSLIVGCGKVERDFAVRVVVPSEYSGLIRIIFTDGKDSAPARNKEQVFRIPESGMLRVGGSNPFLKLGTIEAEDANGRSIPNAGQIFAQDENPAPDEKLFRIVGGTNDGSEFWAVIGTETDERKARMMLYDHERGSE